MYFERKINDGTLYASCWEFKKGYIGFTFMLSNFEPCFPGIMVLLAFCIKVN